MAQWKNPNRIAQLYGYTVCLVAVVTILFASSSLVTNAFGVADPLRSSQQEPGFDLERMNGSLTSFAAFRATHGPRDAGSLISATRVGAGTGGTGGAAGAGSSPDTLTTDQQRARYEALRADALARMHYRALESLTTSLLLLTIALVLFAAHWRWLRRLAAVNAAPA